MEDLMIRRYKVIADYPQSILPVGAVFYMDKIHVYITSPNGAVSKQSNYYTQSPEKYPTIFKPLEWWEERKLEDMPMYLKTSGMKEVFKVIEWDMKTITGKTDERNGCCCSLYNYNPEHGYFPATEIEYNNYIKSKK